MVWLGGSGRARFSRAGSASCLRAALRQRCGCALPPHSAQAADGLFCTPVGSAAAPATPSARAAAGPEAWQPSSAQPSPAACSPPPPACVHPLPAACLQGSADAHTLESETSERLMGGLMGLGAAALAAYFLHGALGGLVLGLGGWRGACGCLRCARLHCAARGSACPPRKP